MLLLWKLSSFKVLPVTFLFKLLGLYLSMYVHYVYTWCPQHSEENVRLLRIGVMMVVSYHMSAGSQAWVLGRATSTPNL